MIHSTGIMCRDQVRHVNCKVPVITAGQIVNEDFWLAGAWHYENGTCQPAVINLGWSIRPWKKGG
ncbi:hypothetical protein ACU610_18255 [Geodermatophilus sp. URMC 61]|uniref:hypothetical protein n=1 Tax=Geodermatophilus sp. URMC 61 TaxID=3423411 RepID=UPI00406C6EA1